jgi:CRP-like cAMP-binding protein
MSLTVIAPPTDVSKFLATVEAFSSLPEASLAAIAKIAVVVEGKAADTIFNENGADGLFYIVWEGALSLYRLNKSAEGGDMIKIGALKQGDVTGLTSMVSRSSLLFFFLWSLRPSHQGGVFPASPGFDSLAEHAHKRVPF